MKKNCNGTISSFCIEQYATFTCIHDHEAYNERLPGTARVTNNNQTRMPDLLWILRFNTKHIRDSLVYIQDHMQRWHTLELFNLSQRFSCSRLFFGKQT